MSDRLNSNCYTSHGHNNWFYQRYYFAGSNSRYPTFQLAMNMLAALGRPVQIVETGCQRQADDLGAGMSTSIWGEYCANLGGHVHTVELSAANLEVCKQCTSSWVQHITYVCSDSVAWLAQGLVKQVDLLYLDSMDYDYGELLNAYGGRQDLNKAIEAVSKLDFHTVMSRHEAILLPAQEHCLKELRAAETSGLLGEKTIVLIDDNQLPGGGKPRLAKDYLAAKGWVCLLDFQQSLWVSPAWSAR